MADASGVMRPLLNHANAHATGLQDPPPGCAMNSEQGHSSFAAAGASGLLLPLACEFAPRPKSMHAPPHMTLHSPEICRSRR